MIGRLHLVVADLALHVQIELRKRLLVPVGLRPFEVFRLPSGLLCLLTFSRSFFIRSCTFGRLGLLALLLVRVEVLPLNVVVLHFLSHFVELETNCT